MAYERSMLLRTISSFTRQSKATIAASVFLELTRMVDVILAALKGHWTKHTTSSYHACLECEISAN